DALGDLLKAIHLLVDGLELTGLDVRLELAVGANHRHVGPIPAGEAGREDLVVFGVLERLELDGDSGIRLFENREDLVVGIDVLGPPGPHLEGDVVARGVVLGRSLAAGVLTVLARGCARVTGGACAKSYGRGEQHAASEEETVPFHGQFSLTIRWGGGVCRWGGGRGVFRGAGHRLPNGTLAGIEVRTGSGDRDPGQVRHECRLEFAVRLGE